MLWAASKHDTKLILDILRGLDVGEVFPPSQHAIDFPRMAIVQKQSSIGLRMGQLSEKVCETPMTSAFHIGVVLLGDATFFLSFPDAFFNLADKGTKKYPNRAPYHNFVQMEFFPHIFWVAN